ncbi:MAG: universal stress protein [Steroidobacteraceae bacterium]
MTGKVWTSIVAVVVDPFRPTQLAAVKAAAIAARSGAKLTLLNTFMIPQPTPEAVLGSTRQIIASAKRQRLQALRKLAAKFERRGIEVDCTVEWDYPVHEAVGRYVFEKKPDLVVAESHRHGRIVRWILANTDWELIRACPCPLWLVRSPSLPAQPRVLVAVDPRHANEQPGRLDHHLLQAAGVIVDRFNGSVDIVHAWHKPATPERRKAASDSARTKASKTSKTSLENVEGEVERLALAHGIEQDHCFVREGDTVDVLATTARQRRTDIVVMGAVSRSLPARPVIGTTAERFIDHIGCDVLIVKPAGFRSPVPRAHATL